mmetsp:Transcript_36126/g.59473  ORF Transcript_36126/g.59473 Transcript_36126/m.59473 type:complete len:474 (-) Transcript_36126:31-1452(-)
MELRWSGDYALHAVATCSYGTGDLILRESAFLHVPDAPPKTKQQLFHRYGQRAPFLFPGVALDWQNIPEDVRQASLDLFWAHPYIASLDGDGNSMLNKNFAACTDLIDLHTSLERWWKPKDLMTFLHIVDLNIHRDDEERSHAEFSGLFVIGSKFSHSCSPNCTWSFSHDGCLQYHAVRPIAAGELFSFSYIGNGMNMVADTLTRRRRLSNLWFVCQCPRCMGPDLCRQMVCPKCGAPKCMPAGEDCEATALEWSCERELAELFPEVSTWECGACGASFSGEDMPLAAEDHMTSLIPEVMQGPPQHALRDGQRASELRERAAAQLGCNHWIWMLATFAWLQKAFVQLQHNTVIDFSESDLRSASNAVARWFESCAPLNTEQRLSALALTLRLAKNIGGPLQAWGYSPEDPLGDGTGAVKRLAQKLGDPSLEALLTNASEECLEPTNQSPDAVGAVVSASMATASGKRYVAEWD